MSRDGFARRWRLRGPSPPFPPFPFLSPSRFPRLPLAVLAVATVLGVAGLVGGQEAEGPPVGEERAHEEGVTTAARPTAGDAARLPRTSCIACHGDEELFDADERAPVIGFAADVHARVGLSCHDCHGGNPDVALAEDYVDAKDEAFAPHPYRGVPGREEIPGFCGSCHSDPTYMRRFVPSPRVDQEREYWTSHHGEALAAGDGRVATCTDCHGVHGIRRPSDPESAVYPTRVAETCAGCHADADRMAGSTLDSGRPLPVDQYARWRQSVHAAALLDREDLSAPTCNDCHGNHGATPPGLDSIAFVCGQCHGREAEIFRASAKHDGFDEHNREYLPEAGDEACAACHEPPEPQAGLVGLHSLGECAACHDNHAVVRPTIAMLSPLPDAPCAFCHEGPDALPADAPDPSSQVARYVEERGRLLTRAEELGLEGDGRFDWMVERLLELSFHTLPAEAGAEGAAPELRPEFRRLFEKFRIGRVHYSYRDPTTGDLVVDRVRRCSDCHAGEEVLGEDAVGTRVAGELLRGMREVTARTARAERILLAARRGGVETRTAAAEVDAAIDAQIQLEVLLHAFDTGEGSEFAGLHEEGLAHADAALEAGRAALGELAYRRRGLGLTLVIILVVLVALGLKIRELSAVREPGNGPGTGGHREGG